MRTIWGLIAALLFASICQGQINPPPGAPNTIRVQFIIRDFVGQYPNGVPAGANRTTHPDFQRVNARDSGIVNRVLGGDRKPAYNTTFRSTANTWTNATTFSWAWNDVPGVNLRLTRLFDMPWSTSTGLYTYSNSDFFPINNDGFGNYGSTGKNFHFCLEYHTQFVYKGNEQFTFTGDDDVYFFVNNILFVDLGGVHGAITENRNLTNQAQVLRDFGMTVGNVYNFDFFFCERHTSASNLRMSTNILLNNCAFLDACGTCSATEPVIKVNPCNSLNCNNGLCNCQNATCVCNPGWTNGPAGFCSQNCGDGIVQGDEQCDVGGLTTPCCVNCRFAAANTPCPSAGRPCVNYVCTGNSTTCGIARPVGTPCTGSGSPPQCQQFQCTASDGSVCGLVANPSLSCTDNDACTTDVCLTSGQCQSTSRPCSATSCRNAGTCDRITGQCSVGTPKANNIGCPDLNATACRQPTCQAGECTLTPKAVNTPCGSASADGCSTQVCDGTTGSCISVEIADKQGTTASCPQPAPGSCVQSLCSGLGCADSPLADGTTCTAALTLNSCQRRGCVNGVCSVLPDSAREGQACTDGGALANFGDDQCNVKVCTNGQCVRKANTAIDGNNCSIASGGAANPEEQCRTYKCQAGTCTRANVNEGSVCTNSSLTTNNCQRLQCTTGTCSVRPFNANGVCAASINNGCTFYRCDDVGNCNSQFAPVNISCGPTDLKCNLSFCTATGTCEQQPVLCNSQVCGGKLKCNQTLGVCEIPAGEIVSCCGNGVIDTAAEECDDPTDPCCVNCLWAAPLTPCGATNECNPKRCTLVAPAPSKNTTCTNNYQNNIACSSAPAASNQCKQLRCGNNTGVCTEVNKLDDTPCTLSDVPFCGEAVCRSGACVVIPNLALANQDCSSAYGAVPECNVAVCSGTACVLSPTNQDGDCTVLPATECRDRKCKAGKCEYTFDAYPKSLTTTCTALTSNTNCLQPGCDGLGNCVLLNVTAGTSCVRDFNEECTVPECDGAGVCALKPIRIDQSCTAARDQQCQVSNCDVNGNCVVSNVNNGTPCTRTDAGQCQDAQCSNGACVLVNTAATQRTCEPTPNLLEDRSCFLYYCQADGTCETPTNKPNGSPCTDSNLCDVDTCTDGVCVHAVNVVCNAPTQPCEVPIGTCVAAFGNCTYGGRGQYAACNPRAAELDPRCNASISGSYRCASGAPDSVCVPACFVGGVCGDGIVQEGEDCDWGDERTGGPCCNITCKWFEDLSPCAYTDPVKVAEVEKQIADLSTASDLPALCFQQRCVLQNGLSQCVLGLNTTADKKCADSGNSKSNRTAILASVIPGALIAMLLAGLGFFFWRRAQKAAESEWLQEYLNAGNVRVENNAAFVENQGTVANAAFQPDGK